MDLRRVKLSSEKRKDIFGLRRKTVHPGQKGPGPCFLDSPMKAIKHQMDLEDARGELEIHYGHIPIRYWTTTSAQIHQNGPHFLE